MNTFLNYLAKLAEWVGRGDHFIGFAIIVAVLVIAVVVSLAIW